MQYQNVFWDAVLMNNQEKTPSILAIGDSWFWYPFPGGSLLNQLGPIVGPKEHVILAYGNNGAEAFDYVNGTYRSLIRNALNLYGSRLSAVFVSGGGNDFAGLNDLRPVLGDDCAACTAAAACFRTGDADGTLGWLLKQIKESYIKLIDQIIGATWPTTVPGGSATGPTKIVVHNYDYAPVTGEGVFGPDSSPWLRPAFEAARVPAALRDACIKHLIDTFTDMLGELVERYPGRVVLVDSRDTLQRSDWANELHPKPQGFAKIAKRWRPVLQELGLAS